MGRPQLACALLFWCVALGHAMRCHATEEPKRAVSSAADYRKLDALVAGLRERNAGHWAIASPQGIDEARFIPIGGIEQWVRIRGRDRSNPVLLFLHGGPGHVTTPWSFAVLTPWEEHFTVVQWDQRGAGRTFRRTGASIAPTLTLDRMTEDGIELAQYLRKHLGKDRIVILGHSFGSILGLRMAAQRPDLFHAYVGTGQVADGPRSERVAYEQLLASARDLGPQRALEELRRLGPPPHASDQERGVQRKWANAVEGADRFLFATLGWALVAPDGSVQDINDAAAGERLSAERLVAQTKSLGPAELGLQFKIPMFFFQGARDYTTPTPLVRQYVDALSAPRKELVLLEEGGHFAVFIHAEAFLRQLVRKVRPLAAASTDGG